MADYYRVRDLQGAFDAITGIMADQEDALLETKQELVMAEAHAEDLQERIDYLEQDSRG